MVSAPLARVLGAQRATFNQRVAEARHRIPGFDTAAFSAFVSDGVDAVCLAVDAVDTRATADAVSAAFDIGLDLVGKGLAGTVARLPWVDLAWRQLPQSIAHLLAQSPVDALGAMTNAVVRLGNVPGVRVDAWIDVMSALAGHCEHLDSFRDLGALCAWHAGMAHLRQVALDQSKRLDPTLAAAAVGAPSRPWTEVHARLQAERWWNPATDTVDLQGCTVGGFSGLGGPFATPPDVRSGVGGFIAESAGRYSLIVADAFGAVVHPAASAEFIGGTAATPPGVHFSPRGARVYNTDITFAVPGDRMQAVASADSVALFSPWSHTIRIVPIKP